MKLFQRTAKDSADLPELVPAEKPVRGSPPKVDLKPLLPSLILTVGGVVAASALLWFSLFGQADKAHVTQLSNAWSESQAGALRQSLNLLAADSRAMAGDPQLLPTLQSNDPTRIAALEKALTQGHLDGLVDVHLNANGQAVQDTARPGPLNYAALDMLHRVESGQAVAPEAYKVGTRWLVYNPIALRAADNSIQGSLLLVVDLQRLLGNLPPMSADIGRLQISQQFGNSPAQLLLQRGQASDAAAVALPSGNPNWKLSFTPGPTVTDQLYSPTLLGIAALLALVGSLLGLYLAQSAMQRRVSKDAQALGQFVQELAGQRTAKAPELSLPSLQALAQALARQPRRKTETPGASAPAAPAAPAQPIPAATAASAPAAATESPLVDPLFQNTDILDIDILDEDQDLLGLEQTPAMSTPKAPQLPASIFRAYDIRGVVGDTLTAETAYWVGRAIGSESLARGEPCVSVGRDGRLSGPELVQQLIQGLVDCGCQVTDIGMVPTPVLYYAANVLEGKSGVMLTGSHNPPDYNGFKIVVAGETLANEQIQALRERIQNDDLASGVGSVQQVDILPRYFQQIRDDIALAKPLKVVVDCGNGVAGVIAPQLIEALGCTVIPLYCDVDGTFPNHHPDPGKPENLEDLIAKVKETGADLGLAFDGDGDRVGVVTNEGTIIYPDRLLMLFAKDVVSRNPGADIIFDVKCTRRLISLISGYGGRPVMWKTGHSLIKKKMKETGALLAGEMSGHIFFKERWYGFDDGIYSAARLLEIISLDKRDAERVFSAFPMDISTPEINITVTDEGKFALIEALQARGQWGEANLTTLDGVRVDYPKGWGLVRASNTTPVLVLRFEADSQDELERIKDVFRTQLKAVDPALSLPF
ncbi:phosphomannomutase/phosphoglucomutase [Pseudomonas nitroreducens]|uniref:phosphomannomutase n=1 Tax=Pseudomonas nitroreducens TaxID=46680 RepID=A0ABS0KRK7_PSENT|nr:phosphomannomutase/phosphoglucomutase [Pseudomonas nitroreducens]MBG6290631.1 phosphomannomutase/phosphoglucomutase [Pseudomonas nitroreducens]NMZ60942.1 phosphomannomutase/phosphoglucomutase [Pseudomonas nitroreducens]SNT42680.1 phosphomannomutase [Pseudomonas nitroreducens]